ncbi:hypothetical protein [uncultured Gammaproteobacteria bacterium]|nr:hypothetical protein [uncultured Gammaproteobacteria bacterium]
MGKNWIFPIAPISPQGRLRTAKVSISWLLISVLFDKSER